jgi:hypothetical protein
MTALDPNITVADLMAMDYRYDYSHSELWDDWEKLKRTKVFKSGSQFKPGMKLCQHFCDNFWQIENAAGQSFARAWQDPVIMDKVLQWGRKGMSQLWLSWIRRAVFMNAGIANSSFYRPHFALQLARMHGAANGVLYDPCAGWGGRMLGTVAAGWQYHACEPNPVTHANLDRMINFIGAQNQAHIQCQTAETFDVATVGPVDIVLTSPPYFNLEVYNRASDQCYNQWPQYQDWSSQWLQPLITHCLANLRPTGISAWNVMNFKAWDLVQDVINAHQAQGWHLVDTLGFNSPLNNIRKLKNRDVTYIFRHKNYNKPAPLIEFL